MCTSPPKPTAMQHENLEVASALINELLRGSTTVTARCRAPRADRRMSMRSSPAVAEINTDMAAVPKLESEGCLLLAAAPAAADGMLIRRTFMRRHSDLWSFQCADW